MGADTSSPVKPTSVTDKGKHDEDGVSARMPVRILMVCNGADEGALSDGEQDADAMALDCCCCESDIWCVIVLMLVIDCSSRCWNVEKEVGEEEEVTVARI